MSTESTDPSTELGERPGELGERPGELGERPGELGERETSRAPRGEERLLIGVQSVLADRPGVIPAARGLSHLGEHSLGWMGLAALGALAAGRAGDDERKRKYIEAGVGAFGAHAASVVIKRIVRRRRPHHRDITVGVGTPSKLSFPSSHATSTTAAAILLGRAAAGTSGAVAATAVIVPPMLLSRLVLGVHYPSDVTAGALIGAASAGAVIAADKFYQ